MIEIAAQEAAFDALQSTLLGGAVERSAVLFAQETQRNDGLRRLLVCDIEYPSSTDYDLQRYDAAQLSPSYVAATSKRARQMGLSIIFAHSHPEGSPPAFSMTDDQGETLLREFLDRRNPDNTHASLVISEGGCRARRLGTSEGIRLVTVGTFRRVRFEPDRPPAETSEIFDRQVRAFGAAGQQAISKLRVGVVGLGGTGSLVVQQLAHLGVSRFVLIDPDVIDSTNLNRVVGAALSDLGKPKTEVATRYVRSLAAGRAEITCVQGDLTRISNAEHLLNVDFIFGCTDSHGSRAILQQIAYQYLIPCIDMGTTIVSKEGHVEGIFGRAQLLAPGHACFQCSGLLNSEEVRRDMMDDFERRQDPYILGAREPAPAVISLNGIVASLAVTMFLSVVVGIPSQGRYLLYDARRPSLRTVQAKQQDNCYICSIAGTLAKGNSIELYARQE